eukprot:8367446-Pyramimonas_sp.AAC.1
MWYTQFRAAAISKRYLFALFKEASVVPHFDTKDAYSALLGDATEHRRQRARARPAPAPDCPSVNIIAMTSRFVKAFLGVSSGSALDQGTCRD